MVYCGFLQFLWGIFLVQLDLKSLRHIYIIFFKILLSHSDQFSIFILCRSLHSSFPEFVSTDTTEEVQVQTHLYKQDKLDRILQIRLPFFSFFYIYKFLSTRHRELWNTILKAIYDNLCSSGVCRFPSQALAPTALTTYAQTFYFLSTSSESSLKHSGSKTVPYLPE